MYIPRLNPYAFKIGPIGVHWYGIFMVMAILGGGYYLLERVRQWGEDPDRMSNVVLWTILWGVVGARFVFVMANDPQWIWTDPLQTLKIWQGGLAIDGALLFGLISFWVQLRHRPILFNHIMDWVVPGICLGIFMVRIGNIFDHQVLGHMTQLGFGRWPEQLWGSFIGVFLLARYFWLEHRRTPPPGYQFWSAMFYYAILRGVIGETTRDNPLYWPHYYNAHWGIGFLTLMQWFTPSILIFTGIMMRRTWRQSAKTLPELVQREQGKLPDQVGGRVGKNVVGLTALVSIIGSIPWFFMHLPSIGGYLLGAGILFAVMYLTWPARYAKVLDAPPPGYQPTGEVYVNPGADAPVSVYFQGIRRLYVRGAAGLASDLSPTIEDTP